MAVAARIGVVKVMVVVVVVVVAVLAMLLAIALMVVVAIGDCVVIKPLPHTTRTKSSTT